MSTPAIKKSDLKSKIYRFLRWTEKYTQTDMVYLAHGGFWLVLGQIISALAAFLLSIAFANLLPKETYGVYRYALSVAGILAIPTLSGMNTAITQAVARGYEGSFIPAFKTKIRYGLFGGLGSLILAGYYFLNGDVTLTISFLIAAVFLPFMDSFSIYDSLLQGKKLFKISTRYKILSQFIYFISLIAVLFLTQNLFLILLTYFIVWTLFRFIFFKITVKKFILNSNADNQTISYGKHLTLMDAITAFSNYLDRILIFHYLGAIEVAVYSFAFAPPDQLKAVLKIFHPLGLPKFSQQSKNDIKTNLFKKNFRFFLMAGIIFLFYIFAAPYIFKFFFPRYIDSVFYSQLFAVTLLASPSIINITVLKAQKETKKLYWFNFITAGMQIILLFPMTYFFGLKGVIIAKIVYHYLLLSLSYLLVKLS